MPLRRFKYSNELPSVMVAFDVIIPIYQIHPTILRECLESVFTQEHEDWHCYVVDGTPHDWKHIDAHNKLIQEYQQRDSNRFSYHIQTGIGVSQARNQAVNCGQSPYLAFLDGDDYWFSNHLSVIAEEIKTTQGHRAQERAVLWFTALRNELVVPSDNQTFEVTIQNELNAYRSSSDCPIHRQYWYFCHSPLWTTTIVASRAAFERIGGFNESLSYCEDIECWLRMMGVPTADEDYGSPHGWGYATFVDHITAFHREHVNAMTANPDVSEEADFQTPPHLKQQVAEAIVEGAEKWAFDYLPCPPEMECPAGMSPEFWNQVLEWFKEGDAKGYRVIHKETEVVVAGQWDHLMTPDDDDDLEALWDV